MPVVEKRLDVRGFNDDAAGSLNPNVRKSRAIDCKPRCRWLRVRYDPSPSPKAMVFKSYANAAIVVPSVSVYDRYSSLS
jgi:hypothetical protein